MQNVFPTIAFLRLALVTKDTFHGIRMHRNQQRSHFLSLEAGREKPGGMAALHIVADGVILLFVWGTTRTTVGLALTFIC